MNSANRFDVLRLLAAWLVLYNHSFVLTASSEIEWISRFLKFDTASGLAVALFFTISGYLIYNSLENSQSAKDFLIKRILRIYPALIGVVLFTIFIVGPLSTELTISNYFNDIKTFQYFKTISGINIKYELPGVFENFPEKSVNGSLWSIALELRCYLILFLLSLIPFSMRVKILLAVIILLATLFFRPLESASDLSGKFFGIAYQFNKFGLMFFLGALFASCKNFVSHKFLNYLGFICLVVFLILLTEDISKVSMIIYNFIIPIIFLWIGLQFSFLPRISEQIGDISYGIYLYAFPIQQLLVYYRIGVNNVTMHIIISTFLTFLLAYISWKYIEFPSLKFKKKLVNY